MEKLEMKTAEQHNAEFGIKNQFIPNTIIPQSLLPKMVFTGQKVVWGIKPIKPIKGAPEGRQRLKMRPKDYAHIFVKTANSIHKFRLEDCGDYWFCRWEVAANHKLK